MSERARDVFRALVETYLATGEPVGSRTLARRLDNSLSPASIRNVMQDLELSGLLDAPHVSAGRLPTHRGLRFFVDALLEVSDLGPEARAQLDQNLGTDVDIDVNRLMGQAGTLLSGLSQCASLVFAPKQNAPLRHIDFVSLAPDRTMVILVLADGTVENRLFVPPPGLTQSAMREAANFLNAHLVGQTLAEGKAHLASYIERARAEIDAMAQRLVEAGVAAWSATGERSGAQLVVRGQAHLLDGAAADLERLRTLFEDLERKEDLAQLVDLADGAEGVRIFIGAENKLFSLSGSAMVLSPYMDAERRIVGAIGVVGPTRLNYARIVPLVDYTARLLSRRVSGVIGAAGERDHERDYGR